MYQNILIAVDGGTASRRGLDEGLRLAKATGGRVMLVHVVNALILESEIASTAYYEALAEAFRKEGSAILEQAATVARDAGVPFECKMIEKIGARASDEIVAAAKAWPAHLIGVRRCPCCWFEIKSRIEIRARLVPPQYVVTRGKTRCLGRDRTRSIEHRTQS